MSKKNDRVNILIRLHRGLNTPIKGASSKAEQTTYRREHVVNMLGAIEDLLKLDGITDGNA